MKLFIIHSCSQENLPNKLIEVDKNIIRLYNGLLLSLKVIKVFLKKNKKLRCWEQALQKLKTRR
uniref:NB-ARC domain-containing protein n=2 Tax=Physcomitrium patens TaxID=3218 RepID=A0A7I4EY75_PHYPA